MFVLPAGSGGPEVCEGFEIKNSVSFNYWTYSNLGFQYGTPTNRRKFTFATWLKRTMLGANSYIFTTPLSDAAALALLISSAGVLYIRDGSTGVDLFVATGVYRDQSAHMHLVMQVDTDNPVMSERIRIEINGQRISGTVNVGQVSLAWNAPAYWLYMGATRFTTGPADRSAIMLSETHFLDGVNAAAESFGFFCPSTGQWRPKRYTGGGYGNNGFYLDYSDGSAATAAALGKDSSGNGNNVTPTLLTVTGDLCDWLTDTTSHNYPTFAGSYSGGTHWIQASGDSSWRTLRSYHGMKSGKWYMEVMYGAPIGQVPGAQAGGQYWAIGLVRDNFLDYPVTYVGGAADSYGWHGAGSRYNNNVAGAYGVAIAAYTDVFMMAYDADTGKLYVGKNGVWFNSSDPVTGANPMYTVVSNPDKYVFALSGWSSNGYYNTHIANFGQRPMKYAPPAGFKTLSSKNAPIERASPATGFQTVLGTGDAVQAAIDGSLVRDRGFLIAKNRDAVANYVVKDVLRGPAIQSPITNGAEAAFTPFSGVANHVAWLFNKSQRDGVDVVLFDKTTTAQTIPHGLGKKPTMMIVKNRTSGNWFVYVDAISQAGSVAANGAFLLDTIGAWTVSSTYWNNTAPTANDFTVGSGVPNGQCIAYIITDVPGLIATGLYTGTGVAGSPVVFTGFQPAFLMKKATIASTEWVVYDSKRNPVNPVSKALFPYSTAAESTLVYADFISSGFTMRSATNYNVSARVYFYLAIAEFAQKFANAR